MIDDTRISGRLAWWLWALFFLNLLARGDGYFVFPQTLDPDVVRGIALAHALVLCATGAWLVQYLFAAPGAAESPFGQARTHVLILGSMALVVILHLLQARRFADAGYITSYPALLLCLGTSLALLAFVWKASPLGAILSSALALKLYPIAMFPITAKRSDMLPIIDQALHSFVGGDTIYQRYLLDNGILTPNVRFPGVVAAYLPAFLLGVDLRVTLLASEVAFFGLAAWRWRRHPLFLPGCALLGFFPYWHLRHELYETPFWVVLLATVFAIDRGCSLLIQVPFLALLLTFHQWGVLLTPLLLIYAARRNSLPRAAALGVAAGLLAVPVIWLFCRGDFTGFVWNTFGYYSAVLHEYMTVSFPPGSMSFTPWIAHNMGAAGVPVISAGAQVAIVALAALTLTSLPRLS